MKIETIRILSGDDLEFDLRTHPDNTTWLLLTESKSEFALTKEMALALSALLQMAANEMENGK